MLILAVVYGCVDPSKGGGDDNKNGDSADGTDSVTPAFDGIASATWDRADGLIAGWGATAGAGAVYTATLEDTGGEILASVDSAAEAGAAEGGAMSQAFIGLAGGEYVLRVATGAAGESGADRALHQWVGENRLVYRSEVPMAAGGGRAIAGDGDLVVVGGFSTIGDSLILVDISDVTAPAVQTRISGLGDVQDVAIGGGLMFAASDTTLDASQAMAVRIWDIGEDVGEPARPVLVGDISPPQDSAHTMFYKDGKICLASTLNQRYALYDLADPANPALLGSYVPPFPSMVHDQFWSGDTLYTAWTTGFSKVDISNPAAPVEQWSRMADWDTPFVHNLAPGPEGRWLAMSEEAVGGQLRIWDTADPGDIRLLSSYQTDPEHSIHNVYVRDHDAAQYAFAAWYVDGLIVFDLEDPANPVIIGSYDSYDGPDNIENRPDGSTWPNVSGIVGAWVGGDHIAAADSMRGLILFDFFPVVVM